MPRSPVLEEPEKSAEHRNSVKVTVNLPRDAVARLREIAAKRGMSLTQALRLAIATELILFDEIERGAEVLIRGKDEKEMRQLIFR